MAAGAIGGRNLAMALAMRRLRGKASLDIGDGSTPDGATPLWVAAKTGQATALELLIEARSEIDARAKDGRSPVFIATKGGHAKCLSLLISAKANVNIGSKKGKTPLIIAVTNDHVTSLELLIAAGAELHTRVDGVTALQTARLRSLHYLSARLSIACLERPLNGWPIVFVTCSGHYKWRGWRGQDL